MHDRYEYRAWETTAASHRVQALFAGHGFEALVSCPSLCPYLDPGVFSNVHLVRQRMPVSEIEPHYPDPGRTRPLVVHSSTARYAKGTPWVLETIDRLRGEIDFEFRLLEGVPWSEAMAIISSADVFIDQLVLGAHGGAAIEAMAAGTPVVGYVKDSVMERYPADIPLVNATRETLDDVLRDLLRDGPRRHELGVRSRAYAEREHDTVRLAPQLVSVYEAAIARRSPSTTSTET
jgi:glycosyltransferase involved in cell wall biosynthesis